MPVRLGVPFGLIRGYRDTPVKEAFFNPDQTELLGSKRRSMAVDCEPYLPGIDLTSPIARSLYFRREIGWCRHQA
jgi:hypothetical protein